MVVYGCYSPSQQIHKCKWLKKAKPSTKCIKPSTHNSKFTVHRTYDRTLRCQFYLLPVGDLLHGQFKCFYIGFKSGIWREMRKVYDLLDTPKWGLNLQLAVQYVQANFFLPRLSKICNQDTSIRENKMRQQNLPIVKYEIFRPQVPPTSLKLRKSAPPPKHIMTTESWILYITEYSSFPNHNSYLCSFINLRCTCLPSLVSSYNFKIGCGGCRTWSVYIFQLQFFPFSLSILVINWLCRIE